MKLILFGPPGSGKGTQASIISKKYNIPHLSTGDILRSKLNDNDELSKELSNIMSSGNLVTDSILNPIVTEKLLGNDCKRGFILDGYPRNITQSNFLLDFMEKNHIELDLVIDFKADEKTVTNRIIERSKTDNRSDDNIDVIKTRLEKYFEETQPLAFIFRGKMKEKFFEIDAMQEISKIKYEIENRLKNAEF